MEYFKSHRALELFDSWMTMSRDAALHLAAAHGAEDIVKELVSLLKEIAGEEECMNTLSAKNNKGNTPLHCAASKGSPYMCAHILSDENLFPLVHIRNNQGETPLFLAAFYGHKHTFLFLHSVSIRSPSPSATPWRRNGGDTILHCTLEREHFGNISINT